MCKCTGYTLNQRVIKVEGKISLQRHFMKMSQLIILKSFTITEWKVIPY